MLFILYEQFCYPKGRKVSAYINILYYKKPQQIPSIVSYRIKCTLWTTI